MKGLVHNTHPIYLTYGYRHGERKQNGHDDHDDDRDGGGHDDDKP